MSPDSCPPDNVWWWVASPNIHLFLTQKIQRNWQYSQYHGILLGQLKCHGKHSWPRLVRWWRSKGSPSPIYFYLHHSHILMGISSPEYIKRNDLRNTGIYGALRFGIWPLGAAVDWLSIHNIHSLSGAVHQDYGWVADKAHWWLRQTAIDWQSYDDWAVWCWRTTARDSHSSPHDWCRLPPTRTRPTGTDCYR